MRVRRIVIGVARPDLVDTFAEVLTRLDVERALVVHGAGGIDELSPAGVSLLATVEHGAAQKTPVDPRRLGLGRCEPDDLRGGNAVDNAATIRAVFAGARGPKRDAVMLNAAAGLVAAGAADDLGDGIRLAGEAIDDGRALDTLERVAVASQRRRGAT
jgi:anthranilate phosphoribosyltransferase